ncbi:MAG: error-prone DNA polymerase [Alphaproteobacteria bacterium 32-64-14]|nr:MAG: error-prone DNA polymerase [Alphaproteobacteria bacterium 32-64-14]
MSGREKEIIAFPHRASEGVAADATPYAEMVAATNFSFLRGASSGRDMVLRALRLGHKGLGIADRNTVAGVVRAWIALKQMRKDGLPPPEKVREGGSPGETTWVEHSEEAKLKAVSEILKRRAQAFKLCVGARLAFIDGTPDIIAYPMNRTGWGRLCRLLTLGNTRAPLGEERAVKGECCLSLDDLLTFASDLLLIVMPSENLDGVGDLLAKLRNYAPTWLGATMPRRGDDTRRLMRLKRMAEQSGVRLIATNDALYDHPDSRDLQDVMTCIREGARIENAGRLLEVNAERHLKPAREMARLFHAVPKAVAETQVLLDLIDFDLEQLKYEYPQEPVPPGMTAQKYLENRTWFHAGIKYKWRIPKKVKRLLRRELAYIESKGIAQYFLTIFDMVRVAENKGILCQGRGSAANSAVCYVLGITSVNPSTFDVLFERFLSKERDEPPDIDVDFEHERREEIIQHIYERYGRHRAAIAATVIHYRPRSAMREVGKVFGLTGDVTARLSGLVWGIWGGAPVTQQLRQAGLDPDNPVLHRALSFASRLLNFPRHLSQHVGGFVLTQGRLDELVPVGNAAMDERTFIEWDKDDIDALQLMKVDVLALGMLTCIRKARDLLHQHGGSRLGLRDFPLEDPAVYDMLCKGESIGVFQVESRAQINMLPRLRPREMYDLVIEVAIVRPGPIQGNMVHPYLKRRNGEEKVEFPSPAPPHHPDELRTILIKTLGVPLFQEQAMKLAMVAARFTSEEANGLRRAMATFRNVGTMGQFEKRMVEGMVARGYERDFAQRCFDQIKGFGSYGFPESHAAAFAQLVYVSSWLKCHHPAAFTCALLNSQPMGFYAPAQLVRDAQGHGVEVRPIDVNFSHYDNTLERRADGALALRIGFRQIDGMREDDSANLVARRGDGYSSVTDIRERGRVSTPMLRRLADADAFRSLAQDRREALWDVRRLPDNHLLPLFAAAQARELGEEPASNLPDMPLGEHVAADYQTTRLSLKAHPMQILRPVFAADRVLSCKETEELRDGRWARTAGVVLVRQRPGNGKAIFITLEDETGITNVLLWARTFERFRAEVMGARLMLVEGRVQKSKEGVTHLMGARVFNRSDELARLSEDHKPEIELTRADEFKHPQHPRGPKRPDGMFVHPRDVRVLPKSRDFH